MDRLLKTISRMSLVCGLILIFAFSGLLPPFPANGESLPDPTRPEKPGKQGQGTAGAKQQKEPPSWELTSVLHSPGRKLAIINEEVLGVGEEIAGARILEIRQDSVILFYRGQRRVIRLLSQGTGLSRTGNEQGVNKK